MASPEVKRPSGDYYVTLTGSKSNAGDFLIRHRAHALLRWQRPDREIVGLDGWKPMDAAALELVNGARALILCGGPALRRRMVPDIYHLPPLDRIRAPLASLAIGWKAPDGRWSDTAHYKLEAEARSLLARVESGCGASVRDYHSAAVLRAHGYARVSTTGCVALYDRATLEAAGAAAPPAQGRIAFSLGVAHRESASMREQAWALIAALRATGAPLQVGLHHGLADARDAAFAEVLRSQGVETVDLSGGHEPMMQFYGPGAALHVGYRVHAHILRASWNLPSILVCEDGRGVGLAGVLGGAILPGYLSARHKPRMRALQRALRRPVDRFVPAPDVADQAAAIATDPAWLGAQTQAAWSGVRQHFPAMQAFLRQLP